MTKYLDIYSDLIKLAAQMAKGEGVPDWSERVFSTGTPSYERRDMLSALRMADEAGITHALQLRAIADRLSAEMRSSNEPIPCALAHSADVRQEIKGKGDVPNSQFAGILKAAESGDAVNTMDLINALWWRVGNQRKELGRKNADVERLRNDIQEITCGDVRLVCPNCRPEKGAQGASRDASSGDTSVALDGGPICEDCPPLGYPTDKTRCDECPRHSERTGE